MAKDQFLAIVETGLTREKAEERLREHAEKLTNSGAGGTHFVKMKYMGSKDGYGIIAYKRKQGEDQ